MGRRISIAFVGVLLEVAECVTRETGCNAGSSSSPAQPRRKRLCLLNDEVTSCHEFQISHKPLHEPPGPDGLE